MQQQQTNVVSVGQVNPGYNGQPGPYGVVQLPYGQPLTRTSNVVTKYRHLQSLYLGVAIIVAGALSIIFNIVDLAVGYSDSNYYYYYYYPSFGFVGHGFWSGIMCVIAGSFGVGASRTRTAGMIRAFLVLSIIAASFCLAQMGVSIAGACIVAYGLEDCHSERNYVYYDHYSYHGDSSNYCSQVRTQIAMESLLAILSLVGGISAICGSALGCRAACCCSCCCCENYAAAPANGVVYYNTPMTVVTQQQQQQPQGMPQGLQYIHPGQPYVAGQPAYIAGSPPYNPPYGYNQPAPQQPAEKM